MASNPKRVKCGWCKEPLLDVEGVYDNPYYYHSDCYQSFLQKRELFDYICKVFKLRAPGPVNYKLRKDFIEQRGYTDKGILRTLKYCFEIRHIKPDGAKERIGLVPTYYLEAQTYWNAQEAIARQAALSMEENIKKAQAAPIVVAKSTNDEAKTKTKLINPQDWWDEEED